MRSPTGRGQRFSYRTSPPRWLKKAVRHLKVQHFLVNGSDAGFLLELVAIFGEMVVVYARWRGMATLCLDMVSEHVKLVPCGNVGRGFIINQRNFLEHRMTPSTVKEYCDITLLTCRFYSWPCYSPYSAHRPRISFTFRFPTPSWFRLTRDDVTRLLIGIFCFGGMNYTPLDDDFIYRPDQWGRIPLYALPRLYGP